jgi:protein subunit release factor A
MKNKIQLELRAAEGGEDAKLLIRDMMDIYIRTCKNNSLEYNITSEKYGDITI